MTPREQRQHDREQWDRQVREVAAKVSAPKKRATWKKCEVTGRYYELR